MKHAAFPGLVLLLSACAMTPAASPPAASGPLSEATERDAILSVVDQFLLSVGNGDTEVRKALEIVEGYTYFTQIDSGKPPRVVTRTNAQMLERPPADPFIERYWDPIVLVRGPTAQFWAPYVLHDDGEIVHCGVDAMQLLKIEGQWKIASSMFTMEPGGCEQLRPPTGSALRPSEGWKETAPQ